MLRITALLIAFLCAAPLVLVLAAWALPMAAGTEDSWRHLRHTLLPGYAWHTFILCMGVAALSGIGGTLAAWTVSHFSFRGRAWFEWAMILPLAMPAYISAYAYGWFLDYAGPVQTLLRGSTGWTHGEYYFPDIRSLGGAVVILGLATMPYVYMLARAAFVSQPQEWWEASASLGANAGRFFRRVALPAARPFIAVGIALALMETLADIGTVGILGVHTLSSGIYRSWFFMGEPLLATRLAGFLLVFVFALMAVEMVARRRMRYDSHRAQHHKTRPALTGWRTSLAVLACFIPVCAGFILPLGVLVRLALHADPSGYASSLPSYAGQTIWLASVAGAITCACAFLMVCAERFHASWLRFVMLFANLGYAIPGAVLAVGIMLCFGWLKQHAGLEWIITGSAAGLLMAYIVRFMATAYSPLHGGMLRISTELDMAAASLGKSRLQMMARLHLPMLKLPLITGFLLVFIDVIKELPATLILRPFDVKPLAVAAYEFASDDRHVEASPYALAIVAIAVLAIALLQRLQHGIMGEQNVER